MSIAEIILWVIFLIADCRYYRRALQAQRGMPPVGIGILAGGRAVGSISGYACYTQGRNHE